MGDKEVVVGGGDNRALVVSFSLNLPREARKKKM